MAKQRPAGWWYPWIFVAGFGVVLIANGLMMFFASSTFSGLSVEKAYKKGNMYNAEIAASKAQAALGWQGDVRVIGSRTVKDGARQVRWKFTLKDKTGALIQGMDVVAKLERPTMQGYDQNLRMIADAKDGYVADVILPMKGQWEVRVIATRRGVPPYRMRYRLKIP